MPKFNLLQNKLFIDKQKRTIYYRHSEKIAYIIPEKENMKFKAYYNRYLVSLLAFLLSTNYFFEWPYALLLSILLLAYMEWYFRNKLFLHYSLIKNYDISANQTQVQIKSEPKGKSILRIILYFAFGILLILNALLEHYNPVIMGGSFVVAALGFYRAIQLIRQFIKK